MQHWFVPLLRVSVWRPDYNNSDSFDSYRTHLIRACFTLVVYAYSVYVYGGRTIIVPTPLTLGHNLIRACFTLGKV